MSVCVNGRKTHTMPAPWPPRTPQYAWSAFIAVATAGLLGLAVAGIHIAAIVGDKEAARVRLFTDEANLHRVCEQDRIASAVASLSALASTAASQPLSALAPWLSNIGGALTSSLSTMQPLLVPGVAVAVGDLATPEHTCIATECAAALSPPALVDAWPTLVKPGATIIVTTPNASEAINTDACLLAVSNTSLQHSVLAVATAPCPVARCTRLGLPSDIHLLLDSRGIILDVQVGQADVISASDAIAALAALHDAHGEVVSAVGIAEAEVNITTVMSRMPSGGISGEISLPSLSGALVSIDAAWLDLPPTLDGHRWLSVSARLASEPPPYGLGNEGFVGWHLGVGFLGASIAFVVTTLLMMVLLRALHGTERSTIEINFGNTKPRISSALKTLAPAPARATSRFGSPSPRGSPMWRGESPKGPSRHESAREQALRVTAGATGAGHSSCLRDTITSAAAAPLNLRGIFDDVAGGEGFGGEDDALQDMKAALDRADEAAVRSTRLSGTLELRASLNNGLRSSIGGLRASLRRLSVSSVPEEVVAGSLSEGTEMAPAVLTPRPDIDFAHGKVPSSKRKVEVMSYRSERQSTSDNDDRGAAAPSPAPTAKARGGALPSPEPTMDAAAPLLSEKQMLQCHLLWDEAMRGGQLWLGLLHADMWRLKAQALMSSTSWQRVFTFVVVSHCSLAYWEPSGNWNGHPRPDGWDIAAGCPRLYEPYAWNVSIIRSSVQPVAFDTFAPSAAALDWCCIAFYIVDLGLGIFAQRWQYYTKGSSDRMGAANRKHYEQWNIYRTFLILCAFCDAIVWQAARMRVFRPFRALLLVVTSLEMRTAGRLAVLSSAQLWPFFLLLALAISYFTLGLDYWFSSTTCTCEPPCEPEQRVPLPPGAPCEDEAFGSIFCTVPALLTLLQTDNFPSVMYPANVCRTTGSPRFVYVMNTLFIVVSKFALLNVFLATFFTKFREHSAWSELTRQKRERRMLAFLYVILVRAQMVHKLRSSGADEAEAPSWSELLDRVIAKRERMLTIEPWVAFYDSQYRKRGVLAAAAALLRSLYGRLHTRLCTPEGAGDARDYDAAVRRGSIAGFAGATRRRVASLAQMGAQLVPRVTKSAAVQARARKYFECCADGGDELNVKGFWDLFDDIVNFRESPAARQEEEDRIRASTSKPGWVSQWPYLDRLEVRVEKTRARWRQYIRSERIESGVRSGERDELSGHWRGWPRMLSLLLYVMHLVQVTLCVEIGYAHCHALDSGIMPPGATADGSRTYCHGLCKSGVVFLFLNLVELLLKWFCSSRYVMVKRHKFDMALTAGALALWVVGLGYEAVGQDERLAQVAAALPTLRMLTFFSVTKNYLRATWLGLRASAHLGALILISLYAFGVLGMELLGCVDGLGFGAEGDLPHASYDTLEYSMLTMLTFYIGESLDPIKFHTLGAAASYTRQATGTQGVQIFFAAFQVWSLVLNSLFTGAILHYFDVRVQQLNQKQGDATKLANSSAPPPDAHGAHSDVQPEASTLGRPDSPPLHGGTSRNTAESVESRRQGCCATLGRGSVEVPLGDSCKSTGGASDMGVAPAPRSQVSMPTRPSTALDAPSRNIAQSMRGFHRQAMLGTSQRMRNGLDDLFDGGAALAEFAEAQEAQEQNEREEAALKPLRRSAAVSNVGFGTVMGIANWRRQSVLTRGREPMLGGPDAGVPLLNPAVKITDIAEALKVLREKAAHCEQRVGGGRRYFCQDCQGLLAQMDAIGAQKIQAHARRVLKVRHWTRIQRAAVCIQCAMRKKAARKILWQLAADRSKRGSDKSPSSKQPLPPVDE